MLAPASAQKLGKWIASLLGVCLLIPAITGAKHKANTEKSASSGQRLTSDSNGTVPTRDGHRLRLATDLGNVVVHTQNSGKVDYHVHLETDASQKDAKELLAHFAIGAHPTPEGVYLRGQSSGQQCSGRLWITLEVNVPRNYSLDISTGGGNIEGDDINGRVTLVTSGGNIVMGNIGGPAHLQTEGGHITVKNVAGELIATTGGGHITTGTVAGNAALRTDGGHIRVASVGGTAHLATGGGNVTIEHSGAELIAETGGGQIEVGDTAGIVHAKTAGGGIRVVRVSGPTNLETADGSIYLTQVDNAVKASTEAGGITAWFVSPAKLPSMCELQSGDGDIVVYLPRQLPITIDARIQMGDEHRVFVDPAFPLKVSYDNASNGVRMVRAEGELNGGGEVLRLRTVAGNIRLVLSDTAKQVEIYKQQMDQLQQKLDRQLRQLERSAVASGDKP